MKKLYVLIALSIISTSAIAADKVVATVNGANIYAKDVASIYKEIPADNVEELGGKQKVEKAIINQLASAEALKQKAMGSGIDKDPEFQKVLKMEKERLIQEEFLRREVEKRITDKEVKSAYDKAIVDFKPATEYEIYNILSKTEEDAKAIVKELEKGADFQKLAVEKSTAANVSDTKGKIGFVKERDLIPDVAKEVTSLKAKTFSKNPIKSPFGWNVFYLEQTRKEKVPTYEESKEAIKQNLYKQELMSLVKEFKDAANVVYK